MSLSKPLKTRAAALHAEAAAIRALGQHRYPDQLRAEILECVTEMRAAGAGWNECKERLGICKGTLDAWRKNSSSTPRGMVRVKVKQDPPAPSATELVLQTPNGNRLSGFNLSEAAQLLRALG